MFIADWISGANYSILRPELKKNLKIPTNARLQFLVIFLTTTKNNKFLLHLDWSCFCAYTLDCTSPDPLDLVTHQYTLTCSSRIYYLFYVCLFVNYTVFTSRAYSNHFDHSFFFYPCRLAAVHCEHQQHETRQSRRTSAVYVHSFFLLMKTLKLNIRILPCK